MPKRKYTYSRQHRNRLVKQKVEFLMRAQMQDSSENDNLQDLDRSTQHDEMSLSTMEQDECNFSFAPESFQAEANSSDAVSIAGTEEIENRSVEIISSDQYASDSSSESEPEGNHGISIERLRENLVNWALSDNVTRSTVTNLLQVLKQESCMKTLPADVRTLLKTPRISDTIPMENGKYCHFGIAKGLDHLLKSYDANNVPEICLSINVDGLPLAKSSKSQLWTILGSVRNLKNKIPFLIGAFHGYKKPPPPSIFLKHFVEEGEYLIHNGYNFNGIRIPVRIDCLICDAPARAYVCCVKNHSGYYACGKCETRGEYHRSVIFPEMNAPLRTGQSFANQTQKEHHTGISPLLKLFTDLVSQVPYDYMHLILLGVIKKILTLFTGKLNPMKLSSQQVLEISRRLIALKKYIPCEFPRKTRGLDELERMKATEFRLFLLYAGLVVLHKVVRRDVYEHFLKLSVAIRLLATPNIDLEQNRYAKSLLELFFIDFIELYGIHNVSYNVHGLLHLADDALRWGALDEFSAFIFENHLQKIKKLIKKNDKPLEQLQNRSSEMRQIIDSEISDNTIPYKLRREYDDGPLVDQCTSPMYREVQFKDFKLSTTAPNNYCILKDESVVVVKNICYREKKLVIIGRKLKNGKPYFNSPMPSTGLGITQYSCGAYGFIMFKFSIVHFTDEDTVEVVPDFWVSGPDNAMYCPWPQNSAFPSKCAMKRTVPGDHWKRHPCRVLKTYDDYAKARANLPTAEDISDLPTADETDEGSGKRKRMPNRKYNCPENVTKKEKLLPKTMVSKRAELEQLRVPSSLMNRSNEITKPSAATASSKLRNAMRQITVAEDKTNSQRGYTDVGEGCSGWTPELDYESDINRRSVADVTQDDVPEPRNKHRIPRLTQKTGCTDVGEGCSGWTPESDCLSDTSGRSLSDIAQTNVPKSRNVHRVPRPAGATAFEKQVLTDLKRLRFDQNEHGELLHKLFDALIRDKGPVGINNNKENVEKVLPDFPLLTVHDFHDLEKLLGTNKTAVSELENFCYGRGGADAASGVRRILAKVFDNSLALRVSWMGFRNNEKLEGTHFAKILFACIKNRYKRSNDRDIETAIINWFRRAGGRVAKEADSD